MIFLYTLLFRKWKTRVKGRDWHDMEWYIRKGVSLDVSHFLQRAKDTNDWNEENITTEQIVELIHQKIDNVSFDNIREDVIRFIRDDEKLDIWSPTYFKDLTTKMKFE